MTCNRCPLAIINNFKSVKPRGDIDGKLFFIGEAPGYLEQKTGYTFVGKAGRLLQFFLEEYGLDDVAYLTNAIKCRPPKNRTPSHLELKTCRPRLIDEIANGKPKIIVLLGNIAVNQFYGKEINSISKLNNRIVKVGTSYVIFGFHPAYIVRKRDVSDYIKTFNLIRLLYKHLVNKYI